MSEIIPHLSLKEGAATRRSYGSPVRAILFGTGHIRPTVLLDDGRTGPGTCLACVNPPCTHRAETPDTQLRILAEFPQDPNTDLCPTDAITIDGENCRAQVNPLTCIGCGLCVVRCPYGAIHLQKDGKAIVSTDDPKGLRRDDVSTVLDTPSRTGVLGLTSSPALHALPATIRLLNDAVAQRFIANLLRGLGVDARVRRRGDMNVRFDGLALFQNGRPGVLEIELTPNAVESPRALLEDVAILHSRYDIAVAQIYPISVVLSLPNVRSEYYQVIQDISNVLHLQFRTITVGALIAMLWHLGTLPNMEGLFVTAPGASVDLLASLGAVIKTVGPEPYPAAFATAK